jgi:hypothetical protein
MAKIVQDVTLHGFHLQFQIGLQNEMYFGRHLGTSIYRSPERRGDDSLVPGSGSERCGRLGFSGYRTT